jgi:UDP-glucose 4-epimerase
MAKNKILVTGGAGFIGSHVTRLLLDSGHDVVILDNLTHGFKDNVDKRAKLIVGDIADAKKAKEALEGVDAVIHMASLIIVSDSVTDPVKYCERNVLGTVKFLESMRESKVKKIIFSSSACVYGSSKNLPSKEDAPLQPENPYGATKASIEAFLQAYNASYNFDVTILRYFNPYGPGKLYKPVTHAIPNLIAAALTKKPIPLYWNGEQLRDFIYIEDLARAHVDVLKLNGMNIFNLGMENGVKIIDVVKTIFEILGYKVPLNNLGERQGDTWASYASSKKLYKAVGWKAKTSLHEGLIKTIEYYKQNPL